MQVQHNCSVIRDRCINGVSNEGEELVSVKLDDSFYTSSADGKQKCLILGVLTGEIDCKYWMSDGLGADVKAAKEYSNRVLRSAVRAKTASWTVDASLMPDEALEHSRDFSEVRAHIVYCFSSTNQLNF